MQDTSNSHQCQRCDKEIPMGKWYCNDCLKVLGRRQRTEELADREEHAMRREGRRFC